MAARSENSSIPDMHRHSQALVHTCMCSMRTSTTGGATIPFGIEHKGPVERMKLRFRGRRYGNIWDGRKAHWLSYESPRVPSGKSQRVLEILLDLAR